MKSSTLKDDILPIILVIIVALLFAFKPAISSNTMKVTKEIRVRAFAPIIPITRNIEDYLVNECAAWLIPSVSKPHSL